MFRFLSPMLGLAVLLSPLVFGFIALTLPPNAAQADHAGGSAGIVNAPSGSTVNSGGEGASWTLLTTLTSGNPHTDLDFFRAGGNLYVAAGTLAIGPNAGGQTIHRLTLDGEVNPDFVSAYPSAACVTDPSQATALQHDVEVTPKGDVLFNTNWGGLADTREPQLLLDATDGPGRCHDQVAGGLPGLSQPPGGLEIVDITDLQNPVEIGLTSHIGEAHTVNVDPKRSHIAYAVTSDTVTLANRPDVADPNRSEQNDLDGFELVDLSSCMNFAPGTDLQTRRDACRPQVYRYRFEPDWARGTYDSGRAGACHEIELYPDDRMACASLNSTILLDMSGAFDDNGTPDDYTDDVPRGTPLPCAVRPSVSDPGPYATGAMVTDCVQGEGGQSLTMGGWIMIGAPSLEGVELLGFVNHAAGTRSSGDDIEISHEAELTHSGRYLLVSDERGGGVVPPGAACPTPGTNDANDDGNGGVHAYVVDQLHIVYPGDPDVDPAEVIAAAADSAYALTPTGEKAIIRATPRVGQGSFCTAHVMQQIPGQNRIFMGWYTQGTQVLDYIEHPDGSFEWKETAWWVPEEAATWVSHIFAFNELPDGSFDYFGATADFGRQAVDVFKVNLPAPPVPRLELGQELPPVESPPVTLPEFRRGSGALGAVLGLLALLGLGSRRRRSSRTRP